MDQSLYSINYIITIVDLPKELELAWAAEAERPSLHSLGAQGQAGTNY